MILVVLAAGSNKAIAQTISQGTTASQSPSLPDRGNAGADAGSEINQLLTRMILEHIPHNFEKSKDWGKQSERWDGIKFHREGVQIKTHRRKKMVNHGTWEKYSVELLDPQNSFSLQIKNMHEPRDGTAAFDVWVWAHLKIHARQSKWVKGVQLYSLSTDGKAQVRLVVSVELDVELDPSSFPPDIVLSPVVTDADLVLQDFRLDRVSKVGGEAAQQITKGVRSTLDDKIKEKRQKLVTKINRQLSKKKGKLRLSIADAVKSKWTQSAKPFLPTPIRQAMTDE